MLNLELVPVGISDQIRIQVVRSGGCAHSASRLTHSTTLAFGAVTSAIYERPLILICCATSSSLHILICVSVSLAPLCWTLNTCRANGGLYSTISQCNASELTSSSVVALRPTASSPARTTPVSKSTLVTLTRMVYTREPTRPSLLAATFAASRSLMPG